MGKTIFLVFSMIIVFAWLFPGNVVWSAPDTMLAVAYPYRSSQNEGGIKAPMPVIGFIESHKIEDGQTLLDIARQYGLGYNQITSYLSEIDPWLPEIGMEINIPTKWILPPTRHEQVVINLAEMRLYRFFKQHDMVKTYPIGIGREGFNTPEIESRVVQKIEKPSWTVPPNAQGKYGQRVVQPGLDNPLGDYWIGLDADRIGIHGTNFAWGVGRRVSYGCMRLYPEHIARFYKEVESGTMVEIIYEPIKVGVRGSDIFLEVHADIYHRIPDLKLYTQEKIKAWGLWESVDPEKVNRCIAEQKAVPTRINW